MPTEEQILAEVANDIKWLKRTTEVNAMTQQKQLAEMNQHLAKSNGFISSNRVNIGKNQTNIKWLWRLIIFVLLSGGLSVAEIQGIINLVR